MKKSMILLLIIILTIGFASVSVNLILSGKTTVAFDKENLQVIFTRVRLNNEESENVIITDEGKSFVYIADDLMSVGYTSIIEYDIKNKSSNYDASVIVSCRTDNQDTIEYTGNTLNQLIEINADVGYTDTLTTKLTKVNTSSNSIALKCTLIVNPLERDTIMLGSEYNISFDTNGGSTIDASVIVNYYEKYGELPIPTKPNNEFLGWYTEAGEKIDANSLVKIKDNHTLIAKWKEILYQLTKDINKNGLADIGDEIRVGTESFYVISHTATELNALAKYNLNVGKNLVPSAPYGIQHKDAGGKISSGKVYGNVVFSKVDGWVPGADPIEIRTLSYRVGAGVTAGSMTALDALYTTNAIVTGYEDYIKGILPDTEKRTTTVRLINRTEVQTLINGGYTWIYDTSYWTQSANSVYSFYVWYVKSNGSIGSGGDFNNDNNHGVRPVITISLR